MAKFHRLPDPGRDNRRLIDVTLGELRSLLAHEMRRTSAPEVERACTVKEIAAQYGVDSKRVYEWVEEGMPRIRTGNQRGIRIWPNQARAWLEEHRG